MSWELRRYLAFQDKVNVVLYEIRYGDEYEMEHEPWAVRETAVKIDRIMDEYANDPETMKRKIDLELERGYRMYLFEKKAPQLCSGRAFNLDLEPELYSSPQDPFWDPYYEDRSWNPYSKN